MPLKEMNEGNMAIVNMTDLNGSISEIKVKQPNPTPSKYWSTKEITQEFIPSIKTAWPIALAGLMQFISPVVSLPFLGQLGETELAAGGLALSFANLSGISLIHGSSIACDTLCSQAYGAKNYKKVGVLVQRGSLFLLILCLPIAGLWLNCEKLLLLLGQEADISRLAQEFMTLNLPTLLFTMAYIMTSKLITSQGIVFPLIIAGIGGSAVNIFGCYLLVVKAGMGIRGSAISNAASSLTMFVILVVVIKVLKYHKDVWHGWNWECLDQWGQYATFAVPSLLSLMVEWGTYEAGGFVVGHVSKTDLAVYSICVTVLGALFQLPYGLEVALSIKIGTCIGSGDVRRAKMVLRAGLIIQVCLGLSVALLAFFLKGYISRIFSNSSGVIELAVRTFHIVSGIMLIDGLQAVAGGGLKGLGLPKYIFLTNFFSYDVIALPLGTVLALRTPLKVRGYWIGMFVGSITQLSIFIGLLLKVNWSAHSKKARDRAGVGVSMSRVNCEKDESPSKLLLNSVVKERTSDSEDGQVSEKNLEFKEDLIVTSNTPESKSQFLNSWVLLSRFVFLIVCSLLLIAGIVTSHVL